MILPRPPLPRWPAASREGIAEAARALRAGDLVLVPTESSYCLAASPTQGEALARVRVMKSRGHSRDGDAGKPLLLLCASLEQAKSLARFEGRALSLAALWPAALTIIVQPIDASLADALGATGLALRVPDCEAARSLAEAAGPYTGTSANRAGEPPLLDPGLADALGASDHRLAGVLDAGILPGAPPSTLVDARGDSLVILRPGAFSIERLPR